MEEDTAQPPTHPRVSERAARAAHTADGLRLLWGDDLPPGPDPVQTAVVDAVQLDDDRGRTRDLVVQGDGLTLDVLHQLLQARGALQDRLLLLPPDLAQRLAARIVDVSVDPGERSRVG